MKGFTTSSEIKLENGLSSTTCFITIDKSEITTKKEQGVDTFVIKSIADIYSSLQAYTGLKPMMTREVVELSGITYEQLSAGNPYEVIYNLYLKVKYNENIVDIN